MQQRQAFTRGQATSYIMVLPIFSWCHPIIFATKSHGMRILFLLVFTPVSLFAQLDHGFKYGAITYADLQMKGYARDTSAVALVLNEYGDTYIQDEGAFNLEMEYHVRIKILKKEGLRLASYEIPLRKGDSRDELVRNIEASTFNLENSAIKESKLESKNIFTENTNKRWNIKRFALPDVREGSIIEIRYILESPFIFNWRTWEFQSDIPKLNSEFRAKIPGNYSYNIVLRGPFQLSKNKTDLVKDCFVVGSAKADCSLMQYGMSNIPAFREEEYMTAKENFLASVNFELIEIRRFDGGVTKYTEEWKDVDRRLATEDDFGDQVKQAKKIWGDPVQLVTQNQIDPLAKAKIIFDQIKKYYLWNENYGVFCENGAKKAYQLKKGNVADINLSLVGALQAAGLQADPVMLSTRKNGVPIMLHPVMSGFNYAIARVMIGADQYWLDATNALHPFGFVPERCLNGKVRVMSKVSEWVDLKPKDKDKKVTQFYLKPNVDGKVAGKLKMVHFGYDALDQRKKFFSSSSADDYWKNQSKQWTNFEVTVFSCQAADSLEKPFVEEYQLTFAEEMNADMLYFSPFMIERWQKNPFRSAERTYPVDFGAPLEEITLLEFELPQAYEVEELPKSAAFTLPQNGGRYIFSVTSLGNKIQMTSNLSLSKSVYSSEEYFLLKELFSRVVQSQEQQIVLKKRK